MKTKALVLLGMILSWTGVSQENQPSFSSRQTIEFAVLPCFYINAISAGYGIKKERIEHVVEVSSSYIPIGAERLAIGVYYNHNYFLKNDITYIPVWLGVNRVNVDNNFEDGGPYYDKMNFCLGSGIGRNFALKNRHRIKLELGLGVALHLENRNSYDNESAFPFELALNEFTVSEDLPIIPFMRFKVRYIIPLS